MQETERWLLPEGMDELLPEQAEQIEFLRRSILKLYQRWGYRYVMTPLVEHMESLLEGAGNDVGTHTFKLIDELTGRLLGVRADITPQVSRIDAHRMHHDEPSRLCYAGPVLLTRPRELGGSRNPIQIGAEIYGHDGIESDVEILELMLHSLKKAGLQVLSLDMGHVGIFRALIKRFSINAELESNLFEALQRKAKPEITSLLGETEPQCQQAFAALVELNGDESILAEAAERIGSSGPDVLSALHELKAIYAGLKRRYSEVSVHFDLAELRGYSYHTGLVFSAYVANYWQAIAQGGRYNNVGKVFGRARSATGYSMDLRTVCRLMPAFESDDDAIFAPADEDTALEKMIHDLRNDGETVVRELPGQVGGALQLGCNRKLVKQGGTWMIENIESKQ